jgi:hypothetical protein
MSYEGLERDIRAGIVPHALLLRASPLHKEMMVRFLDGESRGEVQKDDRCVCNELRGIPHDDVRSVNGAGWTQEVVRLLHFRQSSPNFKAV